MLKLKVTSQKRYILIISALLVISFSSITAQTIVSSLAEFRTAVQNSDQDIVMTPGTYDLENLDSSSRNVDISGSNNTVDLTDVYIKARVGSVSTTYFYVSGDSNTVIGGELEDYYSNGLTEITDFVAYNEDRNNLASGLGGASVVDVGGDDNLIDGLKLTVRGSYPYGYGSMYGINQYNTFGLNKRCGLLVTGVRNTLDNVEIQQRAFGHAIYMQGDADENVVRNTLVEGRVRAYADLYEETSSDSFPYKSDYKLPESSDTEYEMPFSSSVLPIPTDQVFSMTEDGIRAYTGTGSIDVENCIVKKTRGGIRLYLGSGGSVENSTAIDCGSTNFNLPAGGSISNSSGNFSYAPLSDFRLGRSNMDIEWTIIPSPNAIGSHNIADVQGNNHNIVFHRAAGPLDTEETRAIVVTGNNSTIVNETEYTIILESSASGNTIISCGTVTDNGSDNNVSYSSDCEGGDVPSTCDSHDALTQIEAEDFCNQSGIEVVNSAIGFINNGDWISYSNVDFGIGVNSIEISVSSGNSGGSIEIREGSTLGTLLGTVEVPATGSFTTWETVTANISGAIEEKDIYLMFVGEAGYLFDVDWFKFSSSSLSIFDPITGIYSPSLFYPNPVTSTTTIENVENSTITIYDMRGSIVLTKSVSSDKEVLDLSGFSSSIYYVEVREEGVLTVQKLVKN